MGEFLSSRQRRELREQHRFETERRYRKLYEEQGLDRLLNDDWRGSERKLTEVQERELVNHLSDEV